MQDTHSGGERAAPAPDRLDLALCAALFAGAVIYLAGLPRNLGWADESFFLYEAKRIRDGEVLYRDIFEFVAPVAWYVMALLYAVFGATIETARTATDVLHGSIVALVYLACRRLGVGRGLGALAGLAHPALCQPAWPYASPHWFATSGTMLLMVALLARPWKRRPLGAIVPGLLAGLLIGIQQQKGVYLFAGAGAAIAIDTLMGRRSGREASGAAVEPLLFFGASALVISGAIFGACLVLAGAERLFDALVRFPLVNYRRIHPASWGEVSRLTLPFAKRTVVPILAWSPLALLGPLAYAAARWMRGGAGEAVRDRLMLVVVALFSILSIAYYPDFIHIAFIGCLLFIAAADTLERVFAALGPPVASPARWVLCSVLAAACAFQLHGNRLRARAAFPVPYESAFGRIDMSHAGQGKFMDEVRRRLDALPEREIFCYRASTAVYLLVGGRNPTRFQFFQTNVNDPAQSEEILSILKAKKLPLVIAPVGRRDPNDPIQHYLLENYQAVRLRHPTLSLLQRKDLAAPATASSGS